jgi:chemotaxis response regulator CheB
MKPRASRANRPPSSGTLVRPPPALSFPIVGIGASAGGMEDVTAKPEPP